MTNFGAGFTPVIVLDNGEYSCRISKAEEKQYPKTGNSFVEVTVEIDGKSGYSPNRLTIDDRPIIGELKANGNPINEDDVKRWDRNMTTFFDAFGIPYGNFNLRTWVNHRGVVNCQPQYDKNEADHLSKKFKALYPVVKDSASDPQEETKTAPVQKKVEQLKQAVQGEEFPEDITF